MASGQLGLVLRHIRKLAESRSFERLSDGELLDEFAAGHEETAFAALVRRHGPMVLGVCRRVLRSEADAEDAFQGTFLVLLRRARSLGRPRSLANWLHTVAYHVALKAVQARRRQERQVREMPLRQPNREETWHDLQAVLDEELQRLPE